MARYIDADEALRVIRNSKQDCPYTSALKLIWNLAHDCCISCVDAVPIADVVEVKHSEWVMIPVNGVANYRCGNIDCCRLIPFGQMPSDLPYCPYCGAKMDGGKKE